MEKVETQDNKSQDMYLYVTVFSFAAAIILIGLGIYEINVLFSFEMAIVYFLIAIMCVIVASSSMIVQAIINNKK